MREMQTEARKNDVGKPRFDLIPPEAMLELAKLFAIGAAKYGDNNYLQNPTWSRFIAALERHMNAWRRGETHDPEDGQHHLIAVAWNAIALYIFERNLLGQDDRRKSCNGAPNMTPKAHYAPLGPGQQGLSASFIKEYYEKLEKAKKDFSGVYGNLQVLPEEIQRLDKLVRGY